jgi:hypothetical protein
MMVLGIATAEQGHVQQSRLAQHLVPAGTAAKITGQMLSCGCSLPAAHQSLVADMWAAARHLLRYCVVSSKVMVCM